MYLGLWSSLMGVSGVNNAFNRISESNAIIFICLFSEIIFHVFWPNKFFTPSLGIWLWEFRENVQRNSPFSISCAHFIDPNENLQTDYGFPWQGNTSMNPNFKNLTNPIFFSSVWQSKCPTEQILTKEVRYAKVVDGWRIGWCVQFVELKQTKYKCVFQKENTLSDKKVPNICLAAYNFVRWKISEPKILRTEINRFNP